MCFLQALQMVGFGTGAAMSFVLTKDEKCPDSVRNLGVWLPAFGIVSGPFFPAAIAAYTYVQYGGPQSEYYRNQKNQQ